MFGCTEAAWTGTRERAQIKQQICYFPELRPGPGCYETAQNVRSDAAFCHAIVMLCIDEVKMNGVSECVVMLYDGDQGRHSVLFSRRV